jgi:hypothetical protein
MASADAAAALPSPAGRPGWNVLRNSDHTELASASRISTAGPAPSIAPASTNAKVVGQPDDQRWDAERQRVVDVG